MEDDKIVPKNEINSLLRDRKIYIYDNYIEKEMSISEINFYNLMNNNNKYILFNKGYPSIYVPYYLGPQKDKLHKISRLYNISPVNISNHFGDNINYGIAELKLLIDSLNKIRKSFSTSDLIIFKDYHKDENEFMHYWGQFRPIIDRTLHIDFDEIHTLVSRGLSRTRFVENLAAHRDLNIGNFSIQLEDKSLEIIDWESFGPAKPGFDEGKFIVYLSLTPNLQNSFIELIEQNFSNSSNNHQPYLINCFTTATTRVYRELGLILNGKFDSSIQRDFSNLTDRNNFKNRLIISLVNTLYLCKNKLNINLK